MCLRNVQLDNHFPWEASFLLRVKVSPSLRTHLEDIIAWVHSSRLTGKWTLLSPDATSIEKLGIHREAPNQRLEGFFSSEVMKVSSGLGHGPWNCEAPFGAGFEKE